MTYFRNCLHAKINLQIKSISQCRLENQILMKRIAQKWKIALLINSVKLATYDIDC